MLHTFTKILVKGVAGYKNLGTAAHLSGHRILCQPVERNTWRKRDWPKHSWPLTKNSVDAILSGVRQTLCTDMLVLVRVGLQSGGRDWARGRGEGRAGPERKLQCGEVSSAVSQELDTTLRTISAQNNKKGGSSCHRYLQN